MPIGQWIPSVSMPQHVCAAHLESFLTYGVPKPLVFSMIIILIKFGCLWVAPIKHSLSFICGFSHLFHSRDPVIVGQNNGKTLMVVYTWFYQYQHLPTSTNQVGLVFPTCFCLHLPLFCAHSPGNDHRWTASPNTGVEVGSRSRCFDSKDPASWQDKLSVVHKYAWETWAEKLKHRPGFSLPEREILTPGNIEADVIEMLRDDVTSLPPKSKRLRV